MESVVSILPYPYAMIEIDEAAPAFGAAFLASTESGYSYGTFCSSKKLEVEDL